MDPPEIADAARLAANAPPSGVLAPRDAGVGPAWLDLRDRHADVAVLNTARVIKALAPCLLVDDDARLFLSTGSTPAPVLAKIVAHTLHQAGDPNARIAVLKGEEIITRIEEFVMHGRPPLIIGDPPQPLGDRWQNIDLVHAIPPASILRQALEEGATVVIGCAVEEATIRNALLPARAEPLTGEARVRFAARYRVATLVSGEEDAVRRTCRLYAGKHCRIETTQVGDAVAVTLESRDRDALIEACGRLRLVLVETTVPSQGLLTRYDEELLARFDPDMMEFGLDIRSASEWIDQ